MKILTVGNSFSVNACRYLHEIFQDGGTELTLGRANIGGCTLERHWYNAVNDIPTYGDEYGGSMTLRQMLESEKWDAVTLQQQSLNSSKIGTFYPYADILADLIRTHAPSAEIVLHQTWAYRRDNEQLRRDCLISQAQMFMLIAQNYNELSDRLGARILPVGEAFRIMQELTGDTVGSLTRKPDGPSHANTLGEYVAGLVWYTIFTGGDIDEISFVPDEVDPALIAPAKEAVKTAAALYR